MKAFQVHLNGKQLCTAGLHERDVVLAATVDYVAYIPRCRSAALVWQLLRGPAASQRPDRRPLWLSLHCAAARYSRLRSVPRQPNPQGKEQHQENSHSSLPFSFSPYCSLIKSTKLSQRCWHGGSSTFSYRNFQFSILFFR